MDQSAKLTFDAAGDEDFASHPAAEEGLNEECAGDEEEEMAGREEWGGRHDCGGLGLHGLIIKRGRCDRTRGRSGDEGGEEIFWDVGVSHVEVA